MSRIKITVCEPVVIVIHAVAQGGLALAELKSYQAEYESNGYFPRHICFIFNETRSKIISTDTFLTLGTHSSLPYGVMPTLSFPQEERFLTLSGEKERKVRVGRRLQIVCSVLSRLLCCREQTQRSQWDVKVFASPGGPCGEPLCRLSSHRHFGPCVRPPDCPQHALASESGQCQQRPRCATYNQG